MIVFLRVGFFLFENINATFYRKEIRKTKQKTTNGIYFYILGRVAFLQFWMPIIHCTEKEWLLLQLLTKTNILTFASHTSQFHAFINMWCDHREVIKSISSVGTRLNFLLCRYKFVKESSATRLTVKQRIKRTKQNIETKSDKYASK